MTNNGASPVDIRGVSILSSSGALIPANWLSIANNYDRPSPPTSGNGSIDPDDAWTITSATAFSLNEREQAGGNGGRLGVGQTVNFGNAWNRHFEDVALQIELTSGAFVDAAVAYGGGDVWDNSSGSGLWSDAANWADNTEPTAASAVIFPVGFPNGDTAVTLSAAETAAALILSDNYTLSEGSLTMPVGATISVAAGKTATITSALTLNGDLEKDGDGTLTVGSIQAAGLSIIDGRMVLAPNSGTTVLNSLSFGGGIQAIPEPGTLVLISIGVVLSVIGALRRPLPPAVESIAHVSCANKISPALAVAARLHSGVIHWVSAAIRRAAGAPL